MWPPGWVATERVFPGSRYNFIMVLQITDKPKARTVKPPVSPLDLSLEELRAWFTERGFPAFRANQLWIALYRQFIDNLADATTFPDKLRRELAEQLPLPKLTPVRSTYADGGATHKLLFRLHDGREVETVLMEYEDGRSTVCVSSQAGCALGCVFCATGLGGFDRNLSTGEIVAQILYFARDLKERGRRLTNIVYMGMGEPLANPPAVWRSISNLHEPLGTNFSPRRITVSTVGIVPQIRKFPENGLPVNLAISLHSPYDELRSEMMPVNNRWNIEELLEAARDYTLRSGRRISFEYALIANRNSSVEYARALGNRLQGILCHVNLIPLNKVPGSPLQPPSREDVKRFQAELESAGVLCTVRVQRGADILAACGQLRAEHKEPA